MKTYEQDEQEFCDDNCNDCNDAEFDDSDDGFGELDADSDDGFGELNADDDEEEYVADDRSAPAPKRRFTGVTAVGTRGNGVHAPGKKVPTRVSLPGAEKKARVGVLMILAACIAIAVSLIFLSSKILIVAIILAACFAAFIGVLLIRGV